MNMHLFTKTRKEKLILKLKKEEKQEQGVFSLYSLMRKKEIEQNKMFFSQLLTFFKYLHKSALEYAEKRQRILWNINFD